jgi:hypothetical protein
MQTVFQIKKLLAPAISIKSLKVVIYPEHRRSACTCDLHQPPKFLRKKRKGMDAPVQQQPQILFAIFSVGKKERAQNSLKAYRN